MSTAYVGKIGKEDLKTWDGKTSTFNRRSSTGGYLELHTLDWVGLDVMQLYGDAATDEELNEAITTVGSNTRVLWLSPRTWAINAAVTFPSNVYLAIPPGAVFSIAAGITLTINSPGHVSALRQQIFSGAGTVAFTLGGTVFPEWWGATGDGTTDDLAEIQKAVTCLETISGGELSLAAKTYKISDTLVFSGVSNTNVTISGENPKDSLIYNAATDGSNAITVGSTGFGSSEGGTALTFKDIGVTGNASSGHGIALLHSRDNRFINVYVASNGGDGFYLDDAWGNQFLMPNVYANAGHGFGLYSDGNSVFVHQANISNHTTSGKAGVYISGCASVYIHGDISSNDYGIILDNDESSSHIVIDCHMESQVTKSIQVKNEAAGTVNYGIYISGEYRDSGIDIGTDAATGQAIIGGKIDRLSLVDAALAIIAGGGSQLVRNFTFGNDIALGGTASVTIGDYGIVAASLGSHYLMPMYRSAPTAPYGTGNTGIVGDLRYESSRGWVNTAANQWRHFQLSKVSDATTCQTLPTGATPSVDGLLVCTTNNGGATNITAFTGGYPGQQLIIIGGDGGATTITDTADIQLAGAANFAVGDDDTIHLVCLNGTKWCEVARANV